MGELRRMLLANATEQASNTGGGEDLPTKLVFSNGPNEDNARLYEYFSKLCYEGDKYDITSGDIIIYFREGTFQVQQSGFSNRSATILEDGSVYESLSTDPV